MTDVNNITPHNATNAASLVKNKTSYLCVPENYDEALFLVFRNKVYMH